MTESIFKYLKEKLIEWIMTFINWSYLWNKELILTCQNRDNYPYVPLDKVLNSISACV